MRDREGSPVMREAMSSAAVLIDIDAELSCWQQPECGAASELVFLFHEWEPAVRVGIHAYLAYPGHDFDSIEPTIIAAYQRIRGGSRIPWSRAAPAARRVWEKLHDEADAPWPAAARETLPAQAPSDARAWRMRRAPLAEA